MLARRHPCPTKRHRPALLILTNSPVAPFTHPKGCSPKPAVTLRREGLPPKRRWHAVVGDRCSAEGNDQDEPEHSTTYAARLVDGNNGRCQVVGCRAMSRVRAGRRAVPGRGQANDSLQVAKRGPYPGQLGTVASPSSSSVGIETSTAFVHTPGNRHLRPFRASARHLAVGDLPRSARFGRQQPDTPVLLYWVRVAGGGPRAMIGPESGHE